MLPLIFAAAQTLPSIWNAWKYERRIYTAGRTGTVSIVVPPSLYPNAQPSLADVRILTSGANVPFAIETPPPPSSVRWIDAALQDTGYVVGRYAQAVADLGVRQTPVDEIDVVTPQQSFATTAAVDASDDGHTWRTIRTAAPIYDYARDGLATNLAISIPATTSRYVRVRVVSRVPFTISGLRAAEGSHATRALERYPVTVSNAGTASGESTYALSGVAQVPIERLDVTSATPVYSRNAEVEASQDGDWTSVASTTIERTAKRSNTTIAFDEAQAARWRLVVHNGDDPALSEVRAYAFGAPRRIVFDATPGASYLLIYGNPEATAVSFDYQQTHDEHLLAKAPSVALEAPAFNASYVPQSARRPWTDRNRWLLWLALAIVALAIAAVSVRVLRGDASAEAPSE